MFKIGDKLRRLDVNPEDDYWMDEDDDNTILCPGDIVTIKEVESYEGGTNQYLFEEELLNECAHYIKVEENFELVEKEFTTWKDRYKNEV